MSNTGVQDSDLDLQTLPKLPREWRWVVAADLCSTIASGSTPKSDKMYSGSGEIPFIKVYNLTHDGRLDFSVKPTFIDRETHEGLLARSRVVPGDVLINIVGPPLGKVSVVPDDFPEWNMNQAVVLFRPTSSINGRFLAYALLTNSVMQRVTSLAKATAGQHNIGVNMCRNLLPLPVPPLVEQHRIVSKLDELFSDLDSGVSALERAKTNLKRYRASVLKAAVEGRLTSDWRAANPDIEPASELLHRILAARRQTWEANQLAEYEHKGKKPPIGLMASYSAPRPAQYETQGELPERWIYATLPQLAESCLGKMLDKKKHTSGSLLPYLRNVNVRWRSFDTSDVLEMYFDDSEANRFGLAYGDVLVCEGGEPGRAAVWREADSNMRFQKALHRVRCSEGLLPDYLVIVLEHLAKSGMLERFFTGSTIKHFTGVSFARLPIPLPPLAEQNRIVEIVDEQIASVERLAKNCGTELMRASRLRKSILKLAFSGLLFHPPSCMAHSLTGEAK